MKLEPTPKWRVFWWECTGIPAWILCHIGQHAWRYNVCGWTGYRYETCNRCGKYRG